MEEDAQAESDAATPSSPSINWSELTLNLVNFPRGKSAKSSFSVGSYKTQASPKVRTGPDERRADAMAATTSAASAGTVQSKAATSPVTEPRIKTAALKTADRESVRVLVDLGALELKEEISIGLLKKAYRRLAKSLHPDMQTAVQGAKPLEGRSAARAARATTQTDHDAFLKLQRAYKALMRALPAYLKDLTGDNGSASAPGFQRPNAA